MLTYINEIVLSTLLIINYITRIKLNAPIKDLTKLQDVLSILFGLLRSLEYVNT